MKGTAAEKGEDVEKAARLVRHVEQVYGAAGALKTSAARLNRDIRLILWSVECDSRLGETPGWTDFSNLQWSEIP